MQISDISALKNWLYRKLQHICEADPAHLSQYVIALVKKDKTEDELRKNCMENLDVFLQDSTGRFVDELFDCLNKKAYTDTGQSGGAVESSSPTEGPQTSIDLKSRKRKARRGSNSPTGKDYRKHHRSPTSSTSRHQHSSRSHRRSAARTTGTAGSQANKRRRSGSRSPAAVSSVSTGSQEEKTHHRPRQRAGRSKSSTARRPNKEETGPPQPAMKSAVLPAADTTHTAPRPRCQDFDLRGFCIQGDRCPFDHGLDPVVVDNRHISQVLTFPPVAAAAAALSAAVSGANAAGGGYLPSGPIPGVPVYHPTPITSTARPARIQRPAVSRNIVPIPMATSSAQPDSTSSSTAPSTHPSSPSRLQHFQLQPPRVHYEPTRPQMSALEPSSSDEQAGMIPGLDLVADLREKLKGRVGPMPPAATNVFRYGNKPGGGWQQRRFGGGGRPQINSTSCVLVCKIPWHLNNVGKLNEHFKRFGSIVNCKICFNSQPDQTLIEFSNPSEAEAAFRSPEPILANRFIRLYLYDPENPPRFLQQRFRQNQPGGQMGTEMTNQSMKVSPTGGIVPPTSPVKPRLGGGSSRSWRRERDRVSSFNDDEEEEEDEEQHLTTLGNIGLLEDPEDIEDEEMTCGPPMEKLVIPAYSDDEDGESETIVPAEPLQGRSTVSTVGRQVYSGMSAVTSLASTQQQHAAPSGLRTVTTRSNSLTASSLPTPAVTRSSYNRNNFSFAPAALSPGMIEQQASMAAAEKEKRRAEALKIRQRQLASYNKLQQAKQQAAERREQYNRMAAELRSMFAEFEVTKESQKRRQLQIEMKRINAEMTQLERELGQMEQRKDTTATSNSGPASGPIPTRRRLSSGSGAPTQDPAKQQALDDIRGQIMDIEIEMYKRIQDGVDASEQRRAILELKRKVVNLETIRPGAPRNPSNTSGIASQQPTRMQTKLDNRSKTIYVTGHSPTDAEDLHQMLVLTGFHLVQFDKTIVNGTPLLEVSFLTHQDAEQALQHGAKLRSKGIMFSFTKPHREAGPMEASSLLVAQKEGQQRSLDESGDQLAEEDRSWRR